MSSLPKKLQLAKRQLAKCGLSLFSNKSNAARRRGRRAIVTKWHLANLRVDISLRYFKTKKTSRSTHKKQRVIALHFVAIKEIAITWSVARRRKRVVHNVLLAKRGLGLALIIIGVVGAIFFITQLGSSKKVVLASPIKPQATRVEAAKQKPKSLPRSTPTQLRIAKIGIQNTPLVSVGYRADGAMEVPNNTALAGWYKYSPTPGEIGPAIIDGHLDSMSGPAVFWRLNELTVGDIVEVDRSDNSTAKFRVTDVKQFPQGNLPMSDIYGNINYAGLRIITCGGTFDVRTRHYSNNTVVFGELI